MKTNPFYALSASAMLLGCWLLSEALELQAGQLASLLLLAARALALAVFAASAMAAALEASPLGHPSQVSTALLAWCVAAVAFVAALRAHGRAAREGSDPVARRLAGLAMAAAAFASLLATAPLTASDRHRPAARGISRTCVPAITPGSACRSSAPTASTPR